MGYCGFLAVVPSGRRWRRSIPLSNLPSAISAVDKEKQVGQGAGSAGAAFARTRKAETGRRVCGRNLRGRQKEGFAVGPTGRGKGTKIVAIASGDGLPLAVSVESASPAECQLVEAVLAGSFLEELPQQLIGDKAYDSDALDQQMSNTGSNDRNGLTPLTQSQTQNAGWATSTPLSPSMDSRTPILPGYTTTSDSLLDGSTTSEMCSASSFSLA
jgi:hypothetical protein